MSPAAQDMVNRIASGGVDYLRQNFIHVMRDSKEIKEMLGQMNEAVIG